MRRHQFLGMVRMMIATNPQWLGETMVACAAGAQDALDRMNAARGDAIAAMLAALTLAQAKRHSKKHIAMVESVVAKAIDPKNASPVEKEFLQRTKGGGR